MVVRAAEVLAAEHITTPLGIHTVSAAAIVTLEDKAPQIMG
jgi:hypothetical protein